MTESNQTSGVLVVDKPVGPTSHDIVLKIRRLLRTRVGHTGTLDPMASGVLVLTLGEATRLSRFFQQTDKIYEADLQLGTVTASYDLEGEVMGQFPVPSISPGKALSILESFTGKISQFPPMFSAVKVGGERLYKAARRKEIRERPLRNVTIHSIRLKGQSHELWRLEVHCSSGTYIRTLAHDIGRRVGCGACLSRLRRLRSGDFEVTDCIDIDAPGSDLEQQVIPMEQLLPAYPRIDVGTEASTRIANGRVLELREAHSTGGYCRLFSDNRLVAIGEVSEDRIHPKNSFQESVVLRTKLSGKNTNGNSCESIPQVLCPAHRSQAYRSGTPDRRNFGC